MGDMSVNEDYCAACVVLINAETQLGNKSHIQCHDVVGKKDCTIEDIIIDESTVVSIGKVAINEWHSKELRTLCTKLKIKGTRSTKRSDYINNIFVYVFNRQMYYESAGGTQGRKQKHCVYRLLNILFSDDLVDEFGSLGQVKSRYELDKGFCGNDELFWKKSFQCLWCTQ